ncbi:MAG: hypothetical protein JNN07_19555 [Verrucomicrobiales bacterium]|nr:hypothetical protein [Verrucomicrobiales bacterium]
MLTLKLLANADSDVSGNLEGMGSENENQSHTLRRKGGGRAYHSRLEPHTELIRSLRRQRMSWKEIACHLTDQVGCTITFQGVHQFFRRFVKRQAVTHWESIGSQESPDPVVNAVNAKPIAAAMPPARRFRSADPARINLNDPTAT